MASFEDSCLNKVLKGGTVVCRMDYVSFFSILRFLSGEINEWDLRGPENLTKIVLKGLIPERPVSKRLEHVRLGRSFVLHSFFLGVVLNIPLGLNLDVIISKGSWVRFVASAYAFVGPETKSFQAFHGNEGHGNSSSSLWGDRSNVPSNCVKICFSCKKQLLRSNETLSHEVTGSRSVEAAKDESIFHYGTLGKGARDRFKAF
jgi:hypothetical protein